MFEQVAGARTPSGGGPDCVQYVHPFISWQRGDACEAIRDGRPPLLRAGCLGRSGAETAEQARPPHTRPLALRPQWRRGGRSGLLTRRRPGGTQRAGSALTAPRVAAHAHAGARQWRHQRRAGGSRRAPRAGRDQHPRRISGASARPVSSRGPFGEDRAHRRGEGAERRGDRGHDSTPAPGPGQAADYYRETAYRTANRPGQR